MEGLVARDKDKRDRLDHTGPSMPGEGCVTCINLGGCMEETDVRFITLSVFAP